MVSPILKCLLAHVSFENIVYPLADSANKDGDGFSLCLPFTPYIQGLERSCTNKVQIDAWHILHVIQDLPTERWQKLDVAGSGLKVSLDQKLDSTSKLKHI